MRYLLLLLVLVLALGALLPAVTAADEGDIEIVSMEVESRFPEGVMFSVTARSSEEIEDIRVFFEKTGGLDVSAYRPLEFQPGSEVTGKFMLSSAGSGNFFPPGTLFKYSFEITGKGGSVLRTPEQEFVYHDNRFEWLNVSSGLITVYYYGEYVEERARIILDAAERAMERMVPVLGIAPTEDLRIVSYNNYRHMSAALPFRSQTVREQLQTQGIAFSSERVLLVHGFDPTVKGTASHEFTHLLVAEAAGRARTLVPAWLNEGLAEVGNIDPTDDYDAALRYGIFTRRLRPLWYQDAFTGTPDDIVIAYGQGRSVVQFMLRTWELEKMPELFQALRRTLDIDLALEEVYGVDQYGLDTRWRESIGLDPLPSPEDLELRLQEEPDTEAPSAATSEAASETTSGADSETASGATSGGDAEPSPTALPAEAETAQPGPGEAPAAAAPEPTRTPASQPEAAGEQEDGGQPAAGGCSAPVDPTGPAPLALGGLLLMGAPLGLFSLRLVRRRR